MTDIELVKTLIGDTEISDDLVSFYLYSTEQFIKSYCNIDYIPEALKPTLIEISALRVKANTNNGVAAIGEGTKQVASVSDGNQSVSYAAGSSGGKSFIGEEDIVSSYSYILDRYRRLVTDRQCPRTLGSRCLHTTRQHPNTARW